MKKKEELYKLIDDGTATYLDGIQTQYTIKTNSGSIVAYPFDKDRATRVVECVNFCAGFTNEQLKEMGGLEDLFKTPEFPFKWGKAARLKDGKID